METTIHYKNTPKKEIVAALIERDGDICAYCPKPFDEAREGPMSRTIDHYHSVDYGTRNGWTDDEIHGFDNLRLAHRECNSRKSNREWIAEGVLEPRGRTKAPKAPRPEMCDTCMSGRLLLPGENCLDCGSDPQPRVAPRSTQKTPKECSHAGYDHCWLCFLGMVPRKSAILTILEGNEE